MKIIIQLLFGATIGFFGVYFMLSISSLDLLTYADVIVTGLLVIAFILLGWSFLLHRQIKKLGSKNLQGDEEDEIDVLKYKKFSDYSLFSQSSSIIALLALCVVLMITKNMVLIVVGIIIAVISYLFVAFMVNLVHFVYPEREIPSVSDSKYAEKLLETADDGERYIILNGLYKTYHLANTVLIFAMIGATLYSVFTDNSQVFSVVLMAIVLLVLNGNYLFAVRNK
ncbi:DUF3169 family protein [Pseudogracilibacillus sp. SO30301A]|uniref:DUF3169 family protein n=1 Tax=Pseudogracilibacillus sp. SO30301A TaxID=3098291 RepID=UPI00300DFB92